MSVYPILPMLQFDLIIEHDTAIPMDVTAKAFSILSEAAYEANIRYCGFLQKELDLPGGFYGLAIDTILINRDRLVLLDAIEPGSQKYNGGIANAGKWLALLLAANLIGDVVEKKETYQDVVEQLDKYTDQFGVFVAEELKNASNHTTLPDGRELEIQILGDRVRMIIHPLKEDEAYRLILRPPPRK